MRPLNVTGSALSTFLIATKAARLINALQAGQTNYYLYLAEAAVQITDDPEDMVIGGKKYAATTAVVHLTEFSRLSVLTVTVPILDPTDPLVLDFTAGATWDRDGIGPDYFEGKYARNRLGEFFITDLTSYAYQRKTIERPAQVTTVHEYHWQMD